MKQINRRLDSSSIQFKETRDVPIESVVALYKALDWAAAEKPVLLHRALLGSHSLATAWDGTRLIGLGNAITDGFLVVYYPHLCVHPDYQGRGIGTRLMQMLMAHYKGFHQQQVVSDGRAVDFFRKCGFVRSGNTEPLWIYAGHDH